MRRFLRCLTPWTALLAMWCALPGASWAQAGGAAVPYRSPQANTPVRCTAPGLAVWTSDIPTCVGLQTLLATIPPPPWTYAATPTPYYVRPCLLLDVDVWVHRTGDCLALQHRLLRTRPALPSWEQILELTKSLGYVLVGAPTVLTDGTGGFVTLALGHNARQTALFFWHGTTYYGASFFPEEQPADGDLSLEGQGAVAFAYLEPASCAGACLPAVRLFWWWNGHPHTTWVAADGSAGSATSSPLPAGARRGHDAPLPLGLPPGS